MIIQQVEEIKFEQVYIEKLHAKAVKTHKIRDWLTLLNAYEENSQLDRKDATICAMHEKFILKEEFWLKEIRRKLSESPLTSASMDLAFLALDDGYYLEAADLLYNRLLKQLASKETKLRPNYIAARLERLILLFQSRKNFYPGLRKYYIKTDNTRKARELFLREIAEAYDDIDVIYDEYKLWEKDASQLSRAQNIYQEGKLSWESCNKKRLHLQAMDPDSPNFDSLNCYQMIEELPTESEKLWHLRRICLSRHELVNEFLQKFQLVHREDDEAVLKTYKNILLFSHEAELSYLRFLVHRVNKHLHTTQAEEYNNTWAEKVQFFRNQISELIAKPRLTPKTEESIRESYYRFWIDVETSIVRDKESVCELCESLLRLKKSVENYTKYSKCLIRLGFVADAKQVLRRSCQSFKYDFEAQKQYQNFIAIYGDISDFVEVRKSKNLERKQENSAFLQKEAHGAQETKVPLWQQGVKVDHVAMEANYENKFVRFNGSRLADEANEKVAPPKEAPEAPKGVKQPEEQDIKAVKRERNVVIVDSPAEENEVPKKRMHTDGGHTLFIKGLPSEYDEEFIRSLIKNKKSIKEIRIVQKHGVKKNYGYVDMVSGEEASREIEENENKGKYFIAISKPPAAYSENKTIFLCALPETVTQQKIRQLFGAWENHITDVRLKLSSGKNIAYVDFSEEEIKNAALQKLGEGAVIDDKRILVRNSNSHKVNSVKKDNHVVILKQLAFKATERDIRNFFKDASIEDVLIPENEGGKSKGFAFVKFGDSGSYQSALGKKQGSIKGRTFYIEQSEREIHRPKPREDQPPRDNSFFESLLNS